LAAPGGKLRIWITRLVTSVITSQGFWHLLRLVHAIVRLGRREIVYFHQADDPYSHLTLQTLGRLTERYKIKLTPVLVGPPELSAAPEREKLTSYGRIDALRLAKAFGLSCPISTEHGPDQTLVGLAQRGLIAAIQAGTFIELAPKISTALWLGDAKALEQIMKSLPSVSAQQASAAVEAGNARRTRLGHYLGAMFYYEGEFYWGIDRLHHLEARLGTMIPIMPPREPLLGSVPHFSHPPEIDFWFSIRSPYSWLAFPRMVTLARHYGAKLNLTFVLPMVMRGLPVPGMKRRYILFDNVREAHRLGLPFGPIIDPVGPGAERALAVLNHAIPAGKGADFAHAALVGCWSQGIDLASDAGITQVAAKAGLDPELVAQALADDGWRAKAESNRTELFDCGLWGVPSFRLKGKQAHWGQDRIWMLEQDLLDEAIK
jgi:2-hydroxychromene-2-carboxylate isomerase